MGKQQQGTVKQFNSKRGFGFITPNAGGEDVFVHWEAIETDDRWQKLEKDMKVQYNVETDENGKVKAMNVKAVGGKKVACTSDDKEYGDFRYPGTVKWFRGWTGKEGGFGFITMGMEASVGGNTVAEGEEIYVSREELLAENQQNPKICGGMEVEFLLAKTSYDKYCACEVTLPGGEPIGDLPEREPQEKKSKGKGKGKGPQRAIGKKPEAPPRAAKGGGKGKGKGKGRR